MPLLLWQLSLLPSPCHPAGVSQTQPKSWHQCRSMVSYSRLSESSSSMPGTKL